MPYVSAARKKQLEEKWDNEFVPCIHHPSRRCNRANFVAGCHQKCSSCVQKRVDGSWKPMKKRRGRSEQRKWRDLSNRTLKKIKENQL